MSETMRGVIFNLPVKAPSYSATNLLTSSTAPTVSSGFGTSPSIAANNGTAAFTVNVGTGGTATSGFMGLPTATTGMELLRKQHHGRGCKPRGKHAPDRILNHIGDVSESDHEHGCSAGMDGQRYLASELLRVLIVQ